MKNRLYLYFLLLLLFVCTSCKRTQTITPWQKEVLAYYCDTMPDKLRYKAAQFLIENMDAHYTLHNEGMDSFRLFMDSIFRLPHGKLSYYDRMYDSVISLYGNALLQEPEYIYDTSLVTADYLIENIDNAFRMWNAKWGKKYGFEHFCNYVLPYRIGNEPISSWREKYINWGYPRVNKIKDSQLNHFYIYGAYKVLNTDIHAAVYYSPIPLPDFPATHLDSVYVGSCRTFSDLNINRFRAVGIPAAKDFTPQWGSRSSNHEWVVMLPDENSCYPFGPNEKLSDHFFGREDHTLPKVYRQMFAKQKELYPLRQCNEPKPPLFQTIFIKDVTDTYVETSDVTVNLFNRPKCQGNKFVYLAVFDDRSWQIVDWARRKGSKATFSTIGRNIVYLPVYYTEAGYIEPAGYPFALYNNGDYVMLIPNNTVRETVRLTRKYRFSYKLKQLCKCMDGGRFQVANHEDFSDSVTIAVIDSIRECRFHSLQTSCDTTYRYFRYLAPDGSYGNVAEVEMYDSLGRYPKVRHMFGRRYAVGTNRLENVFDGNVLTHYERQFPDDSWAAVEFEEPQHISEVRFLPRNDDNFIREGEQYELYYWDGRRFASIARMEGNREGVLYVDNVPTNALLLLRNHTKGKEERIFTYENGEQVWW